MLPVTAAVVQVMHSMLEIYDDQPNSLPVAESINTGWQAYKEVNRAFRDKVRFPLKLPLRLPLCQDYHSADRWDCHWEYRWLNRRDFTFEIVVILFLVRSGARMTLLLGTTRGTFYPTTAKNVNLPWQHWWFWIYRASVWFESYSSLRSILAACNIFILRCLVPGIQWLITIPGMIFNANIFDTGMMFMFSYVFCWSGQ